ncbi:hypothetical protein [Streptomyces sp. NRRL B-1347]|uniref:hypothetical protein n=1 Tax=Streptomyces sp. NRRL B-1347 TaxID=1476877 RepID=UPI00131DB7EB|nr:hypothetical protein [Streptomyces sp. NRRL B-1347]
MPRDTGVPDRRVRRVLKGAGAVAVAVVALAGCGTATGEDDAKERGSTSASPSGGGPDGAKTARLIGKAIDVTLGQDYLTSTRRMRTDGTTVLRVAGRGSAATCEARSRKGKAAMDFVITGSALYSRGSREALEMSPQSKGHPERVEVMADRWVKRRPVVYEAMRHMCVEKTRRTWLDERMPSLDELAEEIPVQRAGTLRGRPTTKITYRLAGGPLEFHVTAGSTPHLLRVTYPAKDLDETYSGFGKPFRVAAPPRAASETQIAQEAALAGQQGA